MKCTRCGAENEASAKWCVMCGAKLDEQEIAPAAEAPVETPSGAKRCAKCGAENEADAKWCIACGAKLDEQEAVPAAEAPVETPSGVKQCASCGAENEADAKWCIVCGAKLDEQEAVPAAPVETPSGVKQCASCGAENEADAKWCIVCGAKLDGQEGAPVTAVPDQTASGNGQETPAANPKKAKKEKKPKKKVRKGLITLIIVGGLVVGIVIAGTAYYFKTPAHSVAKYIAENDIDSAKWIYQSELQGDKVQEWMLHVLLMQNISSAKKDYENGSLELEDYLEQSKLIMTFEYDDLNSKIKENFNSIVNEIFASYQEQTLDFSTAEENVQSILEADVVDDSDGAVSQVVSDLYALKASRDAYEEAEEEYAKKDYVDALENYRKVIEADENYTDAQEKILLCQDAYRAEILDQVKNPSTQEEYKTAIKSVETALKVLPGDADLTARYDALKQEYAAKIKEDALNAAQTYLSSGDYETAVSKLEEALSYNEGDAELTQAIDSAKTAYSTDTKEKVAEYIEAGKYDNAISLLEKVCGFLSDDTELKTLYEQVVASRPSGLDEMKVSESNRFEKIEDLVITEDVVGNQYDPKNLFKISANDGGWSDPDCGYAKIYLEGAYSRLRGTIAVADDSDTGECGIEIYGDDMILYNSPTLDRASAPVEIDVDLTDISWIEIRMTLGTEGTMYLLLSDFQFYK